MTKNDLNSGLTITRERMIQLLNEDLAAALGIEVPLSNNENNR